MKIRLRMIFIFALILGLMAGQVFITLSLVSHLALSFADISQKYLTQIERINGIHKQLIKIAASPEKPDFTELDAIFNEYTLNYIGPPDKLASFRDSYHDFRQHFQAGQSGIMPADKLSGGSFPRDSYLRLIETADRLQELNTRQVEDTAADSSRVASQTFYLLSIVVILVTLVGITFGWYMAHSFSKGLNILITATEKAARGDFSQPVRWDYPDEFGRLAKAFNNMLKALQKERSIPPVRSD